MRYEMSQQTSATLHVVNSQDDGDSLIRTREERIVQTIQEWATEYGLSPTDVSGDEEIVGLIEGQVDKEIVAEQTAAQELIEAKKAKMRKALMEKLGKTQTMPETPPPQEKPVSDPPEKLTDLIGQDSPWAAGDAIIEMLTFGSVDLGEASQFRRYKDDLVNLRSHYGDKIPAVFWVPCSRVWSALRGALAGQKFQKIQGMLRDRQVDTEMIPAYQSWLDRRQELLDIVSQVGKQVFGIDKSPLWTSDQHKASSEIFDEVWSQMYLKMAWVLQMPEEEYVEQQRIVAQQQIEHQKAQAKVARRAKAGEKRQQFAARIRDCFTQAGLIEDVDRLISNTVKKMFDKVSDPHEALARMAVNRQLHMQKAMPDQEGIDVTAAIYGKATGISDEMVLDFTAQCQDGDYSSIHAHFATLETEASQEQRWTQILERAFMTKYKLGQNEAGMYALQIAVRLATAKIDPVDGQVGDVVVWFANQDGWADLCLSLRSFCAMTVLGFQDVLSFEMEHADLLEICSLS